MINMALITSLDGGVNCWVLEQEYLHEQMSHFKSINQSMKGFIHCEVIGINSSIEVEYNDDFPYTEENPMFDSKKFPSYTGGD